MHCRPQDPHRNTWSAYCTILHLMDSGCWSPWVAADVPLGFQAYFPRFCSRRESKLNILIEESHINYTKWVADWDIFVLGEKSLKPRNQSTSIAQSPQIYLKRNMVTARIIIFPITSNHYVLSENGEQYVQQNHTLHMQFRENVSTATYVSDVER